MDAVTLSRIQFGLNISFHYLFPPLSIGLGLILVIMKGCYIWTKKEIYETITKFWVKIFALIFAVGVATGLVMVFSFGNNWANFTRFSGDVFGSILGAEGIFAFFVESGFLGILLFGWKRVSSAMHFFATIMVALGSHFSGVWIVFANSWMQTPAGHKIEEIDGIRRAVTESFLQVLLNPSSLDRLFHVIVGCWLSGSFLVLSVSSFYLLKKQHLLFAKKTFKIGFIVAGISVFLQLIAGDISAKGVAENQPIKLAAFEGVYETQTPTSLFLFGMVDKKEKKVTGVEVPALLSFLAFGNFRTPVIGLNEYPEDLIPNVSVVFQTYHIMILCWVLMFIGIMMALFALYKKRLDDSKWVLKFLVISVLFPQIANQAGWFSAEMGRQPWAVYGLLRTHEGISENVQPEQIIVSIIMFSLVYLLLFILFIFLLNKKIQEGPVHEVEPIEYRDTAFQGGS